MVGLSVGCSVIVFYKGREVTFSYAHIGALVLTTERISGTGDGVDDLVAHGLVGRVARQLHHEHARLHSVSETLKKDQ